MLKSLQEMGEKDKEQNPTPAGSDLSPIFLGWYTGPSIPTIHGTH